MQSLSISICSDDRKVLEIFKSAIDKNIKVLIPNNLLKSRHLILGSKENGKIFSDTSTPVTCKIPNVWRNHLIAYL